MNFGLKDADLEYIASELAKRPEIKRAVIFGSRAKGNYKAGSDIDIAIYGDDITLSTVASLLYALQEEGPMPYLFDVIDYSHLDNQALKEHIDRQGKVIFQRT